MTDRPNILVMMTDMQRYDTLGCYGNEWIQTPHIDRLAETGVTFTEGFVNNPVCMPSRASFLTGKLPSAHGVRWNSGGLREDEITISKRLQEAGYQTAVIGKMHRGVTKADFGFDYYNMTDHGGIVSEGLKSYKQTLKESGLDKLPNVKDLPDYKKYYGAVPSPLPEEFHLDGFIGKETERFLDNRAQDKPFFCWCSFFGPHLPIDPSSPWDELYRPEDMPLPVWDEAEFENKPAEFRSFQANEVRGNGFGDYRKMTYDQKKLQRFIAYYWAKISMIDHFVGKIISKLDELGLREDTIILFTSDHGDFAGNHRLLFKSAFLYDDLLRVPLIFNNPKRWDKRVVHELVEQIDISSTILSLAGLQPHAGMQGDDLLPLLQAKDETLQWKDSVYAEAVDKKMIRTKEWKLVHYMNRTYGELYHLTEDPHELNNVYGRDECISVQEGLRKKLLDHLCEMEERLHPPVRYLQLEDPLFPGQVEKIVKLPFI